MSGKSLWMSKVLVEFRGEGGDTLGEQTVFVVSGPRAKDKVAAAMEATKDHPLMDERVHAYRTCQVIAEVNCDRPGFAETAREWGLQDDELDEHVHAIAETRASNANNAGIEGQLKFVGMSEFLAKKIACILNDNKD